MFFDRIFDLFNALEPDAPEWGSLDLFFADLQALRQTKYQLARRAEVVECLKGFTEQHHELIDSLGYQAMSAWVLPDQLGGEDLQTLAREIDAFLANLTRSSAHLANLESASLSKRIQLYKEIGPLLQIIEDQFNDLNGRMSVHQSAQSPADEPAVIAPPEAEALTAESPAAEPPPADLSELGSPADAQSENMAAPEMAALEIAVPELPESVMETAAAEGDLPPASASEVDEETVGETAAASAAGSDRESDPQAGLTEADRIAESVQPDQPGEPSDSDDPAQAAATAPSDFDPMTSREPSHSPEFVTGGVTFENIDLFGPENAATPPPVKVVQQPVPAGAPPKPAAAQRGDLVLVRGASPQRAFSTRQVEPAVPDEEVRRLLSNLPPTLTEDEIQTTLLRCIADDQLPEAYWLAVILETIGTTGSPLYPSWLIKALFTTEWIRATWPEADPDLMADLDMQFLNAPPVEDLSETEQVMGLAGVLLPALLDPQLNFSPRLCLPSGGLPAVAALAQGVQDFCASSQVPHLFQQLTDYLVAERGLSEAQKNARAWYDYALTRSINHLPAKDVWLNLCIPNEPVGKAMAMVANNFAIIGEKNKRLQIETLDFTVKNDHPDGEVVDNGNPATWTSDHARTALTSRIKELKSFLKVWTDPEAAEEEIEQRNVDISTQRRHTPHKILYPALGNLMEFIDTACQIVQEWVEAAETVLEAQAELWALDAQLAWMRKMQSKLDSAAQEIERAAADAPSPAAKTAYICLRRSVHLLREPFALSANGYPDDLRFADIFQAEAQLPNPVSIDDLLIGVPVRYPEVLLEKSGEPELEEANLHRLAALLEKEPHRPVQLAVRGWAAQQDYRFINPLVNRYDLKEDERRELITFAREHANIDLRQLRRTLDEAQQVIEQAILDELISEEERSRYIAIYGELDNALKAAEQALSVGKFSERLVQLQTKINQAILSPIRTCRAAALDAKRQAWPGKREQLENQVKLERLSENEYLAVVRRMEESLQDGIVRTITELSSAISRFLDNQGDINEVLLREPAPRDILSDFQAYRSAITRRSLDTFLESAGDIRLDDGRGFDKPQDARRALEAWKNLLNYEDDADQMAKNIRTLASFLGYDLKPPYVVETTDELPEVLKNNRSWRIEVRPHWVVPIPQVGSSTQVPWTYRLIAVWNGHGKDIANILRGLKSKTPYIVLYFDTLTESQQNTIRQIALKNDLHALVLDLPLLVYLGFEGKERLKAFFECALPYTAINPFMGRKGDTNHEIFFGRKNELARLVDPNGAAAMYGGRWIGKTALLHEIVFQHHHPDQKSFVVLTDLLDINTNGQYQISFWIKFAEQMEKQGLIKLGSARSMPFETLLELLNHEIQSKNLRVLALFDEADQFLSSDAGNNFQVALSLFRLSVDTHWNFKAIYSGVHNVQSFHRISNQPLAQLGTAVDLGPLDPQSALDLLQKPLHALGYRFESMGSSAETLALYALSYTNYHPALIQSFGRWLVEHLRQRSDPYPCLITRHDIEAVARKREVRDEIRERFNATLKLDNKYYCITLHMILDQWDSNNGFQRSYSANEIYDAVRKVWPRGFDRADQSDIDLLLQEMRGLGILSMDGDGHYYLRSPNIIGLVGNHGTLEADMATIQNMEPPDPSKVASCHQAFPPGMREYSPLTNQQITELFPTRTGVGLVFGSDALGIDHLATVVEDTANPAITITEKCAAWAEMSIPARSGSAVKDWLLDFITRNSGASQIFVFRRLEGSPEEMIEQIDAAYSLCRKHPSPVVRVIFALNAFSAWDWFQLKPEIRHEYEVNKAAPVLWLRRWDLIALKQRLERAHPENMAKKEWYEKVYEVTGGWHLLVEEFFEEYAQAAPEMAKNVIEMAEGFNRRLADPKSPLRKRFFDALGLFDRQLKYVTARCIQELDGVPLEGWAELMFQADAEQDRAALGDAVIETAVRCADYLEHMGILERRVASNASDIILTIDPLVARLWGHDR